MRNPFENMPASVHENASPLDTIQGVSAGMAARLISGGDLELIAHFNYGVGSMVGGICIGAISIAIDRRKSVHDDDGQDLQ